MGWKEFAASVIGDVLSWPVVFLVVMLLLLNPLRKLIGRVKGAKGFGAELEFVALLENAERSVNRVLDEEPVRGTPAQLDPKAEAARTEPRNSATSEAVSRMVTHPQADPSADPSAAILIAWKSLATTLAELNRSTSNQARPVRSPRPMLAQLKRNERVSRSFYDAVVGLYEVRNQVAHGEAMPTSGAALTFVERAKQLETIAVGIAAVQEMDLDKPLL